MAGWQYLLGALRAPRTAMRTSNEYKIHVRGRIAVQRDVNTDTSRSERRLHKVRTFTPRESLLVVGELP